MYYTWIHHIHTLHLSPHWPISTVAIVTHLWVLCCPCLLRGHGWKVKKIFIVTWPLWWLRKPFTKPLNVFSPLRTHILRHILQRFLCNCSLSGQVSLHISTLNWAPSCVALKLLMVCFLQYHSCLPQLVPCGSWTLLTQHWPCCIVSPCSYWIDTAPSSCSKGVALSTALNSYFWSLRVSVLFLCQGEMCPLSGIITFTLLTPGEFAWLKLYLLFSLCVCHFPTMFSLNSISSCLWWKVKHKHNWNLKMMSPFFLFITKDCVCSDPETRIEEYSCE